MSSDDEPVVDDAEEERGYEVPVDPDTDAAKAGLKRGGGLVAATLKTAVALPMVVLAPLLSAIPPAWKLYHKLHRWTAWQMQKAANADAVANVRLENGHEDMRPAKWVEGGEDEKDLTGWRVKGLGDKRYDGAVHGRSSTRLGKADMIHIDEDSTEQGTWAEASLDNALQADRERYLFRDAVLHANEITVDAESGEPQAVADGGDGYRMPVSVQRPGVMEDALIPINSAGDYDGQVVSWSQYQSLKTEQSDQETVRDAKNSAWAAAKLDNIEGVDMLKWAMIIGAWSFILLFKDAIASFIVNIAGGGSGGAVGSALGMMTMVGGM